MEIYQNREDLFQAGFISEEVKRLEKLRFALSEKDREELRRLDFIRWLVSTGRLTEDLAETNGQ
jgi:DNA-binding PadR family transcriptional regulator